MNLIFALFLAYLAVPKIDIVDGVRPEDLIFVAALVLYFFQSRKERVYIPVSMKYYIVFIGVNFFSSFINYEMNGLTGILFSTRILQYLLWYPIIWIGCRDLSKEQVLRGFQAVSVILLVWGILEFTGLIPKVGNFAGATGRLSLNTGGPYEAAVMVAMLGHVVNGIVLTPMLLAIVVLTQARITTAAVAVGYCVTRPGRTALLAAVVGIAALIVAPQIDEALKGSRFQKQDSGYSMLGLLRYEWDVVPTFTNPSLFREVFIDNQNDFRYMPSTTGDMSFNIRAVRWPIVYKSLLKSPVRFLIGFGPGAWGTALDGYHARLFGEVGVLGAIFFIMWLVHLFRESSRNSAVYFSLLVMTISSIFIDVFVSSKIMPLLWAFAAMQAARHPASQVGVSEDSLSTHGKVG